MIYTFSGKSIEEIAKERSLTKNTIENHLITCLENGLEFGIEKDIHTQFENEIIQAIKQIGTSKLRPLKDALRKEITYLDIRYYIYKTLHITE